ncbi:hypothetical protein [Phaeospirillum tilakii]|uniref:Uncharacterized protein n=1 Tax=Phaeospirillum tilakii TaxID=741673 RepID=A0ABW5C5Y9_9PROT
MSKRNRGGRRRQQGERYPSGDLRPRETIPPEALKRRAELAGCSPEIAAKRPEAGYALGQLLMRGVIDQRQHDAGIAFGRDWTRWALMAGLPAHQPRQPTGQPRHEPTAKDWLEVRDRYLAACAAVRDRRPAGLVWAAVEMVVADEVAQPILDGLTGPAGVRALRDGLDALAEHYRIPRREVA